MDKFIGRTYVCVSSLVTRSLGKLVPDVEPFTVLLVHTLTTNLHFYTLDEHMANPVQPAEAALGNLVSREGSLQVHTVHKVTITRDGASDLATKIDCSINGYTPPFGVL